MRKELHDLLISADEKGQWEFPKNFRWDKRMKNLQEVKVEFETIFGFELDIDKNVQDASFTSDIGLLDDSFYDRKTGTGALRYIFSFRFSNFGNLYTVKGVNNPKNVYKDKIDKCNQILGEKGFVFIDGSEVDEEYDGLNKPFEEGLTWWTRYFDYL